MALLNGFIDFFFFLILYEPKSKRTCETICKWRSASGLFVANGPCELHWLSKAALSD